MPKLPQGIKMGHIGSKLDQMWHVVPKIKVEINNEVKMEVILVKHDQNRSNMTQIRAIGYRLG